MDSEGVKAIQTSDARCRRSNCDKIGTFARVDRPVKRDEGRGKREKEGREEPLQIHSARLHGSTALSEQNINVNVGICGRFRSQFHSRPDTPTPGLSPSTRIARSRI